MYAFDATIIIIIIFIIGCGRCGRRGIALVFVAKMRRAMEIGIMRSMWASIGGARMDLPCAQVIRMLDNSNNSAD